MKSTILKTSNGMYISRNFDLTTNRKMALEFDSVNRAKAVKDAVKDIVPFEVILAPASEK